MSIRRHRKGSSNTHSARSAICRVLVVLTLCVDLPLFCENESQNQLSSGHQLVVVLDVNADQKKVLPVELSLAEGVIRILGQRGTVFSVITFGSQSPALLKSEIPADEALDALRDVGIEQTRADYLSAHLYDALNLGLAQFADDARPKSILIITEGNDGRSKMFKQALSRSKQLRVACHVAMVADHTFYGSKAIQRYGYYLRELAGKTHGRYIEVGGRQKTVPSSIDRFSDGILAQGREQ